MMSFIDEFIGDYFFDALRMFLQNFNIVASYDFIALSKIL